MERREQAPQKFHYTDLLSYIFECAFALSASSTPLPSSQTSSSTPSSVPLLTIPTLGYLRGPRKSPNKRLLFSQHLYHNVCCAQLLSCVWLFETLWIVAHQASLSMEFSRAEYWSRLPFPAPGESSWPRDWTHVSCASCTTWQILYRWATWEALISL